MLYSQKCRSYSPPRSRSGTAHPSSSWCQEVREAAASRAWRGRPADSHMCCQEMIEMSVVLHLSLIFSFFSPEGNNDVSTRTSPTRSDSLGMDWIRVRHPWGVTAAAASPQYSLNFSLSATHHTAPAEAARGRSSSNKQKQTNTEIYWLCVVAVVSFHVVPLFHGLLTFPCQKWIPLRLRGKVTDCALTQDVRGQLPPGWWRTPCSMYYDAVLNEMKFNLMNATNDCREYEWSRSCLLSIYVDASLGCCHECYCRLLHNDAPNSKTTPPQTHTNTQ